MNIYQLKLTKLTECSYFNPEETFLYEKEYYQLELIRPYGETIGYVGYFETMPTLEEVLSLVNTSERLLELLENYVDEFMLDNVYEEILDGGLNVCECEIIEY